MGVINILFYIIVNYLLKNYKDSIIDNTLLTNKMYEKTTIIFIMCELLLCIFILVSIIIICWYLSKYIFYLLYNI